jgi:hypothetical protein
MDISVPIIGFIFVCIVMPRLVKNKPQFYMAIAVTLLILILNAIVNLSESSNGFIKFLIVLRAVLWIVDFVLLILASGGLSLHEFSGELGNAFEVMRRGESTKEVIIPLSGQQAKSKEEAEVDREMRAAQAVAKPKTEEENRSIPLE